MAIGNLHKYGACVCFLYRLVSLWAPYCIIVGIWYHIICVYSMLSISCQGVWQIDHPQISGFCWIYTASCNGNERSTSNKPWPYQLEQLCRGNVLQQYEIRLTVHRFEHWATISDKYSFHELNPSFLSQMGLRRLYVYTRTRVLSLRPTYHENIDLYLYSPSSRLMYMRDIANWTPILSLPPSCNSLAMWVNSFHG